jgi:putative nucleotidyltransferase-like protein
VKVRDLPGSFWPSERQVQLLKTVTQTVEAARETWRVLEPHFDLDHLEDGSFALMPLLSRRLTEIGADVPYAARLKGIARRVWYQNRIYMDRAAALFRALDEAGIDATLFGDAALALGYYEALELRQIAALTLNAGSADGSAVVLARAGWEASAKEPHASLRRSGVARFTDPDGRSCVLQVGLLPGPFSVTVRPARTISLDGVTVNTVEPTDELLRTCALGARRSAVRSIVWVIDAMSILSVAGSDIDWERFVEGAPANHAAPTIGTACRYLASTFDAPIPTDAVRRLEAVRAPRRDRVSAWLSSSGGIVGSAIAPQIARDDRSIGKALLGIPAYLRDSLGVARASELPGLALRRRIARSRSRHER